MGHEAIGIVEAVGSDVRTLKRGDFVIMPFAFSDGTCEFCHEGLHTACSHGGFFGTGQVGGAQAEAVRVPLADGTLYVVPGAADEALMPALLSLSDVMGTGHHAAVVARVARGKKAAVIGDGAVGLCGVIAAKRFGAEQIFLLGRHPDRIALAKVFGATDIVSERGEAAVERVRALTGGKGVHSVLECVGSEDAMTTSVGIARAGGAVGRVGVPHYDGHAPFATGVLSQRHGRWRTGARACLHRRTAARHPRRPYRTRSRVRQHGGPRASTRWLRRDGPTRLDQSHGQAVTTGLLRFSDPRDGVLHLSHVGRP